MILTALLIGLAGSLHCVGMCSPLAMAVSSLSPRVVRNRILYNAGRIITYGLLGAIVGAFGVIAGFTTYQSFISAALGIVLLLLGLSGVTLLRIPIFTKAMLMVSARLRSMFGRIAKQGSGGALFLLGTVNGLLPCGLTYIALAYCITLPNAAQGFAFMSLFGLGTLPAMIGAPMVWKLLLTRVPRPTVVVMILLGSLLVFRSFWFHVPNQRHEVTQVSEITCP